MDGATWHEDHVEAAGVRVRCVQSGDGPTLVHLHGAGALTQAHDLLARERRVIAFERLDAAETVLAAVSALGIDEFDLMATSDGAATALRSALIAPERVRALVLESPAAIRPEARDPELETAMTGLQAPVLVVFGTTDGQVPPEMGRVYRRLLPNCQLLFVYDAGHAVAADRPEAFTEAVSDFLERHEQYVVSRRSSVLFP
jgi:pimeloyl-ACP methyl ester carboxylesterase